MIDSWSLILLLKAFVIHDSTHKFKDLEDVIKVARSLGKQAFRTKERVFVKRIWQDPQLDCYVAVVEGPDVQDSPGVGESKKMRSG